MEGAAGARHDAASVLRAGPAAGCTACCATMPASSSAAVVPPELDGSFLSPHDQAHFAEFGYLVKKQLFSPEESERISTEFNQTIDSFVERPIALEPPDEYRARVGGAKDGVGKLHDGSTRTMIGGPIEHRMSWILDHPKILALLRGVIGEDFNVSTATPPLTPCCRQPSRSQAHCAVPRACRAHITQYCSGDGNYYSGDTHWHPDGNWSQLFAVKVAFYLDTLDEHSGCVRLIPGSHRPDHPVRTTPGGLQGLLERTGTTAETLPWGLPVPTKLGDVVIFNHGKPRKEAS
jgi:ectoine hydroxylase-related dioxygenase (phytanoyl-CoA dioxygenase family)